MVTANVHASALYCCYETVSKSDVCQHHASCALSAGFLHSQILCYHRQVMFQLAHLCLCCVQFVPPGELIEGLTVPQENPFARLMGSEQTREYPLWRYEVDLNDPTPFNKQLFDQVCHGLTRMH